MCGQLERVCSLVTSPVILLVVCKGIIRINDIKGLLMLVKVSHIVTEIDRYLIAVFHSALACFLLITGNHTGLLTLGLIRCDQLFPCTLDRYQVTILIDFCKVCDFAGQLVSALVCSNTILGVIRIAKFYDTVGPLFGRFHILALASLGNNHLQVDIAVVYGTL